MDKLNSFEERFKKFLTNIGQEKQVPYSESIIVCDSDKCEQYRESWRNNDIPFEDGVMLYLITKMRPYNQEARVTISPCDFVIKYYPELKKYIPE